MPAPRGGVIPARPLEPTASSGASDTTARCGLAVLSGGAVGAGIWGTGSVAIQACLGRITRAGL